MGKTLYFHQIHVDSWRVSIIISIIIIYWIFNMKMNYEIFHLINILYETQKAELRKSRDDLLFAWQFYAFQIDLDIRSACLKYRNLNVYTDFCLILRLNSPEIQKNFDFSEFYWYPVSWRKPKRKKLDSQIYIMTKTSQN